MTLNYFAIFGAAVAAFIFGWGWYMALGTPWQKALGLNPEDCKDQKMPLVPMAISFVTALVMAFGLACLGRDLGIETVTDGALFGFTVGLVFILPTTATNNAFQGRKYILTLIDSGHWIGGLTLMGAIVAAFS